MNGFMHGSQGLQTRPNQAEFLANSATVDRHKIMMRGIGNFDLQQGNAFDYPSGVARSSERSEVPESPVHYDFLGSQQQFMRNPTPVMSHPQPTQQPGYDDVQSLQQQLLYRQMQEMQRQQQLAQCGQPHNQLGHLSDSEKLLTRMHLPPMLGGMPIQNAPNRIWSNELGNELKVSNNSQMLVAGNMMNWPQCYGSPLQGFPNGSLFSNENGQNVRSSGAIPQHIDRSLYGTPVFHSKRSMNYTLFQGMADDCNDMAPRAAGELVQTADTPNFQSSNHGLHLQHPLQGSISNPKQALDGRNVFGNAAAEGVNDTGFGNVQQESCFSHSIEAQSMHEKQGHIGWAEQLQQKPEELEGSCGVTNLDSTEEKLLFSADDENWDCHATAEGYLHGNPVECNQFGFQSVQSGSWSALMQEALGASSSDTGVQEEWGGSSYSQKESLRNSQAAELDGNTKQQLMWDDKNMQHAFSSTSKAFPFTSSVDKNPPHYSTSDFQHASTKVSYEQDDSVRYDSSHEPFKHLANKKQLDKNEEKLPMGGGLQVQIPIGNVPNGIWPTHMNQQSVISSPDRESNAPSMPGSWHMQRKMLLPSNASHPGNKGDVSNIKEISSPSREGSRGVLDVDWRGQYSRSSNTGTEMDTRATLKKPNATEITQEFHNKNQGGLWRNAASHTTMNVKADAELSRNMQVVGSALNTTGKPSSDPYDSIQENSTVYTHKFSHPSQLADGRGNAGDSRLSVKDTQSPLRGNQNLTGQSGRRTPGPSRFQYHAAENLEANVESQSRPLNSQVSSQLFMQGWKNQEQEYAGHPPLASNVANNAAGKMHPYELLKNAEEAEGRLSTGLCQNSSPSASLDGSTPLFSQDKQIGRSQNMLELLHKVDGTNDSITSTHINMSDHSLLPSSTEGDPPDDFSSSRSSVSQGFGLGLAPPVPACSDDVSPNHRDGVTNVCIEASKETAQILRNYITTFPDHPYARSPQYHAQQQHLSSSTGLTLQSHSSNFSVGNATAAKEQLRHASYVGQMHDSNVGHIGDQFSQASLSTSRVFPSRLASSSVNRAAAALQLHSLNTGFPQSLHSNVASNMRNPDQQPSLVEPNRAPQSSALSGMLQQGGFSTMVQDMWTNVSAQRQLSAVNAERAKPALLHPMNSLSNSRASGYRLPPKADDQCNSSKINIPPESTAASDSAYHSPKLEESKIDSDRRSLPSDRADIDPKFGELSEVQKKLLKQASDGNSAVSIPSLVRLHEQKLSKGKHIVDAGVDSQTEHASLCDSSQLNHDGRNFAINSKLSDTPTLHYSLLQQMQAMKDGDSDFGRSVERKPGSVDLSNEATQVVWQADQRFASRESTPSRLPADGKLGPAFQQGSSGVKMPNLSAKENEDNTTKISSSISSRETFTQHLPASAHNDLQKHLHSLNTMPILTTSGGNGQAQISSSMAPTWFNHFGNYKDGQVLAIYDSIGTQYCSKVAPQECLRASSEIRMDSAAAVQRDDGSQADSVWQNKAVAMITSSHTSNFMKDCIPQRPKKRKSMAADLVPWGKQVTEASEKLLDIRMNEEEWAYAANRLVEKVDGELYALEECSLLTRSKRRLVLATLLVQQLFIAVPARLLRENARTSYESVTCYVAKVTLSDACNLLCHVATNSSLQSDGKNKTCERIEASENDRDNIFLKVAENFIGRTNKLESELLRLNKRVSVLDLKMECQELERCSIINRFAKFHGRPQNDGAEGSLRSESLSRRILPQRQAIMLPFPRNVPEGAHCLSL